MGIKDFLSENQCIQVGINVDSWDEIIEIVALPLIVGGYVTNDYPKAVINNTKEYGAYYVFDEGIAIPHARPECGVIKNCFSLATLKKPLSIHGSEPVDIVVMFGGVDSNVHITEGIASIVGLLEDETNLARIRKATSVDEVLRLL
ncbi:PTS sugar transporter subunit IIA [Citrobacter sp. CK196]|uniref:PTS sugar transporter subunit IIA n=1 Tax=Enterobacteriaceae TaxID=543 RepID=UPI002577E5D1|nr:PTS sugar transporter subunit IIA [Citrobacter sp. CK196]MDM2986501.1 PTS sugar transporter subunit IIA [Citrobacter sp. CK196]